MYIFHNICVIATIVTSVVTLRHLSKPTNVTQSNNEIYCPLVNIPVLQQLFQSAGKHSANFPLPAGNPLRSSKDNMILCMQVCLLEKL